MILTRKSGALVFLLAVVALLLQGTLLSRVSVFGVSLWVLPVVTVIFGLLGGSLFGATVGFGLGLLSDLAGGSPIGLAALVFMGIGYGGGVYRERTGAISQIPVISLSAAAVFAAELAFMVFGQLSRLDYPWSWSAVPELVVPAVYGAIVALPVYAVVYGVLRSALILEPRESRAARPRPDLPDLAEPGREV